MVQIQVISGKPFQLSQHVANVVEFPPAGDNTRTEVEDSLKAAKLSLVRSPIHGNTVAYQRDNESLDQSDHAGLWQAVPAVSEATQCAGAAAYNVINVGRERQALIKHDTQVPHSGRAGDSGAHETDVDRWKPLNVLPGSG